MVDAMRYQVFAAHVQGENHKTPPEKECQDFSLKDIDNDMAVVIIADGHGSDNCFRSDKGSKMAAEQAKLGIQEFIRNPPPRDEMEKKLREFLVKSIRTNWFVEVEKHYSAHPFSEGEIAGAAEKYQERYRKGEQFYRAYGTTLIAVAAAKDYWFGIHIGDGKCTAFYPDGTCDHPIPPDDNCFLNITTSICDDDAVGQATIHYSARKEKEPPVMVFINSDGVDDSYPAGDNEKYLEGLYRTIAVNFCDEIQKAGPVDGFENGKKQVEEFLPDLSKRGSGDDVSMAALIDVEALIKLGPILRQQVADDEKEKAD
ncbi:hypothetical protein FACS189496_5250 [Bacilli bacterium]|nr:hypothetical protein FACS189496_5250 [Bacilli bacterium]